MEKKFDLRYAGTVLGGIRVLQQHILATRSNETENRVGELVACVKELTKSITEIQTYLTSSQQGYQFDKKKEKEFRGLVISWIKRLEKQRAKVEEYSLQGKTIAEGHRHRQRQQFAQKMDFQIKPNYFIDSPASLKKVKLLNFNGLDPRGWITRTETYFRINQITFEIKISLAEICIEGSMIN